MTMNVLPPPRKHSLLIPIAMLLAMLFTTSSVYASGDLCNAGNHHCGEPPVPPPPCNPEVEFCGLPQGADGTQ
jgi:hypothetical protein